MPGPEKSSTSSLVSPAILSRLPVEVRRYIYGECFNIGSEYIIYFMHNGRTGKFVARVNPYHAQFTATREPVFDFVKLDQNLLNLPLTCHQICEEAMPVLYSQATFRFLSADALIAFSAKVPRQYFEHITKLSIEVPGYTLLEESFDDRQWIRVWNIIASLPRLRKLLVDMWDPDSSLKTKDWASVFGPMREVRRTGEYHVRIHWEPWVLPKFDQTQPFRWSWQDENGEWCYPA